MAVIGTLMLLDRRQRPFLKGSVEIAMLTHQPEIVPILLGKGLKIETPCFGDEGSILSLFTKNVIGRAIMFRGIELRALVPIAADRFHESGICVAFGLVILFKRCEVRTYFALYQPHPAS